MPKFVVTPQIFAHPLPTGQEASGGEFDTLENATAAATEQLKLTPNIPRVIAQVVSRLSADVSVSAVAAK